MENLSLSSPPPGVRVLIAEDSATQAQRLRYLLEKNGYEVAVGVNGRRALEIAADFRPELILSDVVMPEMDGYELAWHVKADPRLRGVPVILVTNMSEAGDVMRGLECGADHFVLKPYNEAYLLARIDHVLHNRGLQGEDAPGSPVEVRLNGERHLITADRRQILQLLLSTYDAASQRNKELSASQDELRALNRRLDSANVELANANTFMDSVIEHIPSMLSVKDAAELRYVRLNRAGQDLLGYSEAEICGKIDADVFPVHEAEFFAVVDRQVLTDKRVIEIPEETVKTRDGSIRTLRTTKIPILDGQSNARYLLGISEDVTEQRAREREVLQLNAALELRAAELEAAYRELDAFAASVSHDLRAPLRHIEGYAEMLQAATCGQLSDDAQRYLATIRDASARMGTLTEDLLAFSRSARVELQRGPVALGELVAGCRKEFDLATAGREIDWRIGPLPEVVGDQAMLRQVFLNLLDNAIKYTKGRERTIIEIRASVGADGAVTVHVRDNGVGFDPSHADKLFGVFQRLHARDEFEGTGIGLANVHRIVARHGGRTWADGLPGNGATFSFSLPATPGGSAEQRALAHQEAFAACSETRQALRWIAQLSGTGKEPADAADVAAAIEGVWERVVAAVTPVVGSRGGAVLYQRSLYLTSRHHPWLHSVFDGFHGAMDLSALRIALATRSRDEAASVGVAHLQSFRGLLDALIGPESTGRLLRSINMEALNRPAGKQPLA